MKKLLLAIAFALASPVALAQPGIQASEEQIREHIRQQNLIVGDMAELMPKITLPDAGDNKKLKAAISSAVATVRQNLPKAIGLTTRANALPPLASTGDLERDANIATIDDELKKTAASLEEAMRALIKLDEVVATNDEKEIQQAIARYLRAAMQVSRSGVISLRAAKAASEIPAKIASLESMALLIEGTNAYAQFSLGFLDVEECIKILNNSAAAMRKQLAVLRRDDGSTSFASNAPLRPEALKARADFPTLVEKVAKSFEDAASKLSLGTFSEQDHVAFSNAFIHNGLSETYDLAWTK